MHDELLTQRRRELALTHWRLAWSGLRLGLGLSLGLGADPPTHRRRAWLRLGLGSCKKLQGVLRGSKGVPPPLPPLDGSVKSATSCSQAPGQG